MTIKRNFVICSLLAIVMFGCMVGPNYQKPDVPTPSSWRFEEKETKKISNIAWWEQFDDPALNKLIQTALQGNMDVLTATARIEEFMGRYEITDAALYPQIGGSTLAGRARVTNYGIKPMDQTYTNPAGTYNILFYGRWELDLWGKLRRATEAARADLLSQVEARDAVMLSLVSAVANAYVNLRSFDKQLDIARRTVESRKESLDYFQLRFEGGITSELQLSQVKSEYEQALATVPVLEDIIAHQEDALCVLLGQNPGPIPRGKSIDDLTLPPVPADLPSEVLAKRPDIRQAEQVLIGANARIGVAKALFYPTIALTGAFGMQSISLENMFTGPANQTLDTSKSLVSTLYHAGGPTLSDLFTGPARVWNWGVPVTVPIYTGGALQGQEKAAEAFQQEILWRYVKTIQEAFREVEDALIDQHKSREELEIQDREVESLRNYDRVAHLRFDNGYTSYIEVLDAERSLFFAELSRAQTKGAVFRALVNLYQAMGGGWSTKTDTNTTLPASSDIKASPQLNLSDSK